MFTTIPFTAQIEGSTSVFGNVPECLTKFSIVAI